VETTITVPDSDRTAPDDPQRHIGWFGPPSEETEGADPEGQEDRTTLSSVRRESTGLTEIRVRPTRNEHDLAPLEERCEDLRGTRRRGGDDHEPVERQPEFTRGGEADRRKTDHRTPPTR
jgi:hypothetical protein